MKKNFLPLLILLCGCSVAVFAQKSEQKTITVEVSNHWNQSKTDEPVVIQLNKLSTGFRIKSVTVMDGTTEIPSQLDDLNNDRQPDELAFVLNLPAKSKKRVTIHLSNAKSTKTYEPRVYAEMLVSDKRGKHVPVHSVTIPGTSNIYNQMHHHGPAMESELVAYRLYFDQKQTVDIYGKFNKGFEIKESQFYPTDEQLARGFGDDVLLVKGSCGVGALKGWDGTKATHIEPVSTLTERIIAYGPVRTISEIEVTDWAYQGKDLNMTTRYTLYAGHRDLRIDAFFEEPLGDEVFSTGVIDIPGSVSSSDHNGLIGCWGTNWPVNDTIKYAKETVGLATFIPQKYVKKEVKDKLNYLYTVGVKGAKSFHYYTTFTSMKETFGYKTPEAWFAFIRQWKEDLEHPAEVRMIK
ncbi:MAG: DUF4861 domain-containing protein [Bacteroides sp.]|uniref:DUF4861 domain-containing protein n=1 Tax=Bacteroides sp. TaxID=29523 RepID=UPI001B78EB4F|nr:DUF4861 domain-containing protein [Bacteroides sp.]MBP6065617.1 DUF4861 domain-containing protein [Bacteroides sp.]